MTACAGSLPMHPRTYAARSMVSEWRPPFAYGLRIVFNCLSEIPHLILSMGNIIRIFLPTQADNALVSKLLYTNPIDF